MPTSFSHIPSCLITLPLLLLQSLQNSYRYLCHCYHYFHITLLLNTSMQILSLPGVVELTTKLPILESILWLSLCQINKFGLNTLPMKTTAIPYTCGLLVSNVSIIFVCSMLLYYMFWMFHGLYYTLLYYFWD